MSQAGAEMYRRARFALRKYGWTPGLEMLWATGIADGLTLFDSIALAQSGYHDHSISGHVQYDMGRDLFGWRVTACLTDRVKDWERESGRTVDDVYALFDRMIKVEEARAW